MSVLVDTSVWSLLFRKKGSADHPEVYILTSLLRQTEDVALTGSILQEILQAFRSETEFRRVSGFFEPFPIIGLERDDFITAAKLHRQCASNGVAASTVDCQIAVAAIRNGYLLLTADKDFEHIAKHSQLKLL